MRDLMEKLHTVREEQEAEFYEPEAEDEVTFSQEAVVFETTAPALEHTLKEAYAIRKEIKVLHFEVERLGAHSERFGTSALGKDSQMLQETEGAHRVVSRIAKTQHDTLTHAFHTLMSDYNKAEMMQRSIQRRRGLGRVFTEPANSGARSSRWALKEIQGRHKELLELESRLKLVHDLFLQMAILVEEQGSMLNNIEANVNNTQEYVDKINVQMKKALKREHVPRPLGDSKGGEGFSSSSAQHYIFQY
ncbi:hypothetical protein WMY93_016385 [Mugilogobius chulae]|uniref:t-SNARE coiled-coil homology domain-containing protein n=1 Tax=Mugilogobius chulae TaxID=88201 RepID=A0AAW0NX63_9GOBI